MFQKKINQAFFAFAVFSILFGIVACSDSDSYDEVTGGVTEGNNAQDTVFVYDTLTVVDTVETRGDTNKVELKGFAQKGPFVKGSVVTVLELNDKFQQTGRAFRGKTDANGAFDVNSVSLDTTFAILEATGFYMNEISGQRSNSMISLYAFVDYSETQIANVNVFTSFEYDRISYLVHEKGVSIAAAQKQANAEVAKIFDLPADSFDVSTTSIFGDKPQDGAMLAMSVLLSGERSDAEISELLANLGEDFKENGALNDMELLVKLADYSIVVDTKKVRENILSWKIGESVAPFETYVARIREHVYGLGECSEKNKGEIKLNENKFSAYFNTWFKCDGTLWNDIYYNTEIKYGVLKDARDGYEYRTVKIGEDTWMAENLRYRTKGALCYDGREANCEKYGALYNYEASIGACPEGSHVSTAEEWRSLIAFVGADSSAKKLRARGAWDAQKYEIMHDDSDKYGFSAMPSGVYVFGGFGEVGWFMSSTRIEGIDENGNVVEMEGVYDYGIGGDDSVSEGNARFTTSIAIRCVLDK